MRKVVIVEDETAAAVNLRAMLQSIMPDAEVVAVLESVEESVEFFSKGTDADVVFMDIHLADGDSFRIFKSVTIDIPIIFTTAYDEYALEAFKVNSIDYLLKPFKEDDLQRALDKLQRLTAVERMAEREHITKMAEESASKGLATMLVRYKDKIIPVDMDNVAFFYTLLSASRSQRLMERPIPLIKRLRLLDNNYRRTTSFAPIDSLSYRVVP